MDEIYLPLLSGGDRVEESIDRMSDLGRHAVVVAYDQNTLYLFTNQFIMDAWQAGAEFLGEFKKEAGNRLFGLGVNAVDYQIFEDLLDKNETNYGYISPIYPGVNTQIRVFSRHESGVAHLRSLKTICRCDGPSKHKPINEPQRTGNSCESGDGYHYKCC